MMLTIILQENSNIEMVKLSPGVQPFPASPSPFSAMAMAGKSVLEHSTTALRQQKLGLEVKRWFTHP